MAQGTICSAGRESGRAKPCHALDAKDSYPIHKGRHSPLCPQIKCPRRTVLNALRIPVQDVYKIRGVGTVVAGRVASGMLHVGMKVSFSPGGSCSEIGSIELNGNVNAKLESQVVLGSSINCSFDALRRLLTKPSLEIQSESA